MPGNFYDIKSDFGALGNGVADDYPAILNALNTTPRGATIFFPPGRYITRSVIEIKNGQSFEGLTLLSDVSGGGASVIASGFDPGFPVIKVNGSSVESGIRRLGVGRLTQGQNTDVGIQLLNTNYALLEDVWLFNHGQCLQINGAYGTQCNRVNTWAASAQHVAITGQSNSNNFTNCTFGRNGGADVHCQSQVWLQGSQWDTTRFVQCQFNQGVNSASYVFYVSGYNNPSGILEIVQSHAEAFDAAFIRIDDSTSLLQRIVLTGNTVTSFGSAADLLSQSGAKVADLIINGNILDVIVSLDRVNRAILTGNIVSGRVIINQGRVAVSGNVFQGQVLLQGVSSALTYGVNINGSIVDQGSGNRQIGLNVS